MSRYQTRQQHLPRLWEGQVVVDTEENEKEEQMFKLFQWNSYCKIWQIKVLFIRVQAVQSMDKAIYWLNPYLDFHKSSAWVIG